MACSRSSHELICLPCSIKRDKASFQVPFTPLPSPHRSAINISSSPSPSLSPREFASIFPRPLPPSCATLPPSLLRFGAVAYSVVLEAKAPPPPPLSWPLLPPPFPPLRFFPLLVEERVSAFFSRASPCCFLKRDPDAASFAYSWLLRRNALRVPSPPPLILLLTGVYGPASEGEFCSPFGRECLLLPPPPPSTVHSALQYCTPTQPALHILSLLSLRWVGIVLY